MGSAAESAAAGGKHGVSGADDDRALETLRQAWGDTLDIGGCGLRWQTSARDGTGQVLTRASADGLAMALRISHGRPR